jgi:DNA processing protein
MEFGVIEVSDKNYPKALKEALKNLISSLGPKRLFYKGDIDLLLDEKNCLAVVGSRHLTRYGRQSTEQIITECAAAGITIVSGFMYGGDEAAHSACVKAGGKTIAVMPCGINLVHPPQQKDLYQKILDTGGLIISEYESNLQPQTWMYVQRDRIVAGLSKAVLVTEAALNSGSLITASYAKKYGRKIFALPGQITSEVSKGTLKLIKEGAEPVAEANDILSFYKVLLAQRSAKREVGVNQKTSITLEQKILDYLKREPMNADDLSRTLAVPVAQLGTTLSLMQLKGIIINESGKFYVS